MVQRNVFRDAPASTSRVHQQRRRGNEVMRRSAGHGTPIGCPLRWRGSPWHRPLCLLPTIHPAHRTQHRHRHKHKQQHQHTPPLSLPLIIHLLVYPPRIHRSGSSSCSSRLLLPWGALHSSHRPRNHRTTRRHGSGQAELPATRPTTATAHAPWRDGPTRHTLSGGLHQPAADPSGQPQQAPPTPGRLRPAACFRECNETVPHHWLALKVQATDADLAQQDEPARRRRRLLNCRCHHSGAGQPYSQIEQGEYSTEREAGATEGDQLHHTCRTVSSGPLSHTRSRPPIHPLHQWPATSFRRRTREGKKAFSEAPC
jgi:hypothetical protein